MKQTTLEDLFYGNINPCEISFVRGSEYGKSFDKVTELSKSVYTQLINDYINIPKVGKNIRHRKWLFLCKIWYRFFDVYITI